LKKARDELKKVMGELDSAKDKESSRNAAFEAAKKQQLETQKIAEGFHDASSKEKADHDSAEAAYLKQKALVDKLQAELDAAAAKVKKYRDAEDAGGGVYNTHKQKSFADSLSSTRVLLVVLAGFACW